MTSILYDDLDKVCRGCLCKNGEMRPLFGSFLDNMLRTVAEIEVNAGDGLPELMCVPCVLQVSRAFTFKQQCQRSDQTLRSFYRVIEKTASNHNENSTCESGMHSTTLQDNDTDSDCNTIPDAVEDNVLLKSSMTSTETTSDIESSQTFEVQYPNSNQLDSNNLDKCLLIVHTVPCDLDPDQLVEEISLTDSNVANQIKSEDAQFISSSDNLLANRMISSNDSILINQDEHDTQETESDATQAIHETSSIIIKQDINDITNMPLDINDIQDDLVSNDFGNYSDNESDDPTSERCTKDDIVMNLFSTNSSESEKPSQFYCTECNSVFETLSDFKSHLQSHHKSHSSQRKALQSPTLNTSQPKKSFECPECHKVFSENKILKRHLKIHNPVKPHVCNVCKMAFAESSNLTKHMKKHTGELRNVVGKPNLCSVCGKGFKWASSLSKHMKHHTKHKILTCPYCPKYYVEARSLNIHLRSHTGEKPFVCDICNKAFTQMGNLEKHIRVHTGEKPYNCPICGKGFSQSGYVAIHLRTHTGEKPYVCSECGKSFAGSNTLAIHKRTHTGERPYPCLICKKSFARQETAMIHQRTHTGEKPNVCQICHRGFTSSGHLTGHMRSHNGIKTHECHLCRKRFAGSSSLKVHMKTHANKNAIQEYDKETTTTVYECNVCKQNIPPLALNSPETIQAYDHQIIDGVLICTNVSSIIDESKTIEEIHDENGTNIILTSADDSDTIGDGQQVIISLSDLK